MSRLRRRSDGVVPPEAAGDGEPPKPLPDVQAAIKAIRTITRDRAQTTVVTFWQKRTSRSIPVLPFSNSLRLLRFSTSHPHRPVHRSPSRPALYEPRRLRLYRMRHADRERQSGGGKRQDIVKLGHDGPPL